MFIKNLRLLTLLFLGSIAGNMTFAQQFNVDTIQSHGDIDHCINFVYMGEGYTATEQTKFINSVRTMNNGFFQRVPFSNYKNFFNVYTIGVISPESGLKHPRTANDCPAASVFPSTNPNNYFGATFDYGGIHRLVATDQRNLIASVAANHFPSYDQILIIGNTDQYGGAGGDFAYGTENALSLEVMLHEIGHSFAGLADEYWAGDYYARESVNMTNTSNATPTQVKWKDWLGVDSVGIYQYCCGGTSSSWYKPHYDCLMQYLERDFCPVCRQRIIEKIYEVANPIIKYQPDNSTTVDVAKDMKFELSELLLPIPNTLKTEWKLNGTIVATNVEKLEVQSGMLKTGSNTLEATITDTTFMLRLAPSFTKHIHQVLWTINARPSGIDINSEKIQMTIKAYPNPTKDFISFETKGLPYSNNLASIKLINALGQVVYEEHKTIYSNVVSGQIDVRTLANGFYFLQFETDKISKTHQISVLK